MGTDIHIVAEFYKDERWRLADVELPEYRNYWAFAVLADVRNGYGFAGFSTGDPITPISEPRGLPDDMSTELQYKLEHADDCDYNEWIWFGNHSFSWVTLRELLDYDLDAPLTQRGMVDSQTAQRFRNTGQPPDSWTGFTTLPDHERIEWHVPIRQRVSLVTDLIDAIKDLGEPDHVRIVFGFDD
ncbi:MAG: hypothetical protein U9R58_07830 [Chloroflexota bacterium]|nr:hypothetical protein [Chloroflexota bacterium]